MTGLPYRLTRWSLDHPRAVAGMTTVLCLVALLRLPGLEMRTSNLDLIDTRLPEPARFLDVAASFGTLNPLVVVLETSKPEAAEAAVDLLTPLLERVEGVGGVLGRLPYPDAFLEENGLDAYLCAPLGDVYFMFVQPADHRAQTALLAPMAARIREVVAQAAYDREAVRIGFTGIPQFALDDQEHITGDITRYSLPALVLIALLFFLGLRSPAGITAALLALVVALVLTLGIASVVPGYLTLLSALFASMILGLGVDYGIHLGFHVARAPEGDRRQAVLQSMAELGAPLQTACLTTVGVFLLMLFSGFKGFADLGLITAVGMLVCFACMCTVMPVLVVHLPERLRLHAPRATFGFRPMKLLQHPAAFAAWAAVTVAALVTGLPAFDGNYLNLQPSRSEAVRLQRLMEHETDFSPDFAAFTVPDAAAAVALAARLREAPSVAAVRSITDLAEISDGPVPEPPASFRNLFVDDQGRYAVYAYPMNDVWSDGGTFNAAMQAIDPQVTGMPVLGAFMTERSYRALRRTVPAALVLLFLVAWWDFRRLVPALITLSGPLLTLVWMGAALRWCGQSLNPLNIMALPLVLGIAVDDAVHLLHGLRATGDVTVTLRRVGGAVLLTTLTTLAAFGALLPTDHRGLFSFCLALCVGVTAAFFNAVVLIPKLQALTTKGR